MSHVQMTPTLASTRSVFFQQYNFDFDPLATLYGEFRRMAKGRKWRQGSNSKKFEEGWHQCFGPDIPVGYNIDKRAFPVGARIVTDDAMSSLMRSVQSLHLEGRPNGNRRAERANLDFTSYYGSDADITEKWQTLCQDCGIDPVPASIKQCKKVQPLPLELKYPQSNLLTRPYPSLGFEGQEHQHLSFSESEEGRHDSIPFPIQEGAQGIYGKPSKDEISFGYGEAEQVLKCTAYRMLVIHPYAAPQLHVDSLLLHSYEPSDSSEELQT